MAFATGARWAARRGCFLSYLAKRRGASASTHKQALAARLFLYKRVPDIDLPWMQEIARHEQPNYRQTQLRNECGPPLHELRR
jgi:hypothetical protein